MEKVDPGGGGEREGFTVTNQKLIRGGVHHIRICYTDLLGALTEGCNDLHE